MLSIDQAIRQPRLMQWRTVMPNTFQFAVLSPVNILH